MSSQQRMRKNIAFSSKNADIFEVLSQMQAENKNISDYLCDLVRKDLEPTKIEMTGDDIDSLEYQIQTTNDGVEVLKNKLFQMESTFTNKLLEMESILKDIQQNKIVVSSKEIEENEVKENEVEEDDGRDYLDSNMALPSSIDDIDGLFFSVE